MIETNLAKIEALAEIREEENIQFRMFLKSRDNQSKVDKIVHQLHEKITAEIDCRQCGNCCITSVPAVTSQEIKRYAELENISVKEYKKQYCEKDDFEDITCLKNKPCRYLAGRECSIYDIRPHDCRMYPHTHKKKFNSRSWRMLSFYSVCPIVFNLIENLKGELGFRYRSNRR